MIRAHIFCRLTSVGFLFLLLLAGCAGIERLILPTLTPFPTPTLHPSKTPTVTLTPTETLTPMPTPEPPVLWGTPVLGLPAPLSAGDAANLALITVRGRGIPQAAVWSPDNDMLAVASTRGVYVWSATDQTQIFSIEDGSVRSLAWSPDARLLAGGRENGSVDLWNVAAPGSTSRRLSGQQFSVLALAFSPDKTRLASAAWDGTITAYDVETGARVCDYEGMLGTARSLVFNPEGDLLFAWSPQNPLKAWDAGTGKPAKDRYTGVDAANRTGSSAAFAPLGGVFTVDQDRQVRLFNTDDGTSLATVRALPAGAELVSLSSGAELLAVKDSGSVRLFNPAEPSAAVAVLALPEKDASASLLALSPDGMRLAWVGASLWLWDDPLGLQTLHEIPAGFNPDPAFAALPALFSGSLVFPRSSGALARLDPLSGLLDVPYYLPGEPSGAVALSSGLDMAAYAVENNQVVLVDLPGGQLRHRLKGASRQPGVLAFSPDRKLLASAGADRALRFWNTSSGVLDAKIDLDFNPAGLAFAPNSDLLAAWGGGKLHFYQSLTWQETSAESSLGVVFASNDEEQALLQVKNGRPVAVVTGGDQTVTLQAGGALAFSPDGELLAAADTANLTLWDVHAGARLAELPLSASARAVFFNPGGELLYVLTWDGIVAVYGVP